MADPTLHRSVEICVSDVASAIAARLGGADRVELCADLVSGGITPSLGMIQRVIGRSGLPTQVLIRPRGGDFVYDDDEIAVMKADIAAAKEAWAAGVVLGVLKPDGTIDTASTNRLVEHARPLSVTFHKAIDLTPDPVAEIDYLVAAGVDRVLTSGGLGAARDNVKTLRAMVERAEGRLAILIGGGLREDDLPHLLDATGASEVHLGSGVTGPASVPGPFGSAPDRVDAERVRRVVAQVKRR
jgi:copper homeostasis protein